MVYCENEQKQRKFTPMGDTHVMCITCGWNRLKPKKKRKKSKPKKE